MLATIKPRHAKTLPFRYLKKHRKIYGKCKIIAKVWVQIETGFNLQPAEYELQRLMKINDRWI